ncbi:MAG: hypothetical protein RR054_03770 [Clostridia bacterium]
MNTKSKLKNLIENFNDLNNDNITTVPINIDKNSINLDKIQNAKNVENIEKVKDIENVENDYDKKSENYINNNDNTTTNTINNPINETDSFIDNNSTILTELKSIINEKNGVTNIKTENEHCNNEYAINNSNAQIDNIENLKSNSINSIKPSTNIKDVINDVIDSYIAKMEKLHLPATISGNASTFDIMPPKKPRSLEEAALYAENLLNK